MPLNERNMLDALLDRAGLGGEGHEYFLAARTRDPATPGFDNASVGGKSPAVSAQLEALISGRA